jgi:hypothetical protein
MQRKHCEEGRRLDTVYLQSCGAWSKAEADRRIAAGVGGQGGPAKRNELKLRADEAKAAHAKAQGDYLDHVVSCLVCNAHVFGKGHTK